MTQANSWQKSSPNSGIVANNKFTPHKIQVNNLMRILAVIGLLGLLIGCGDSQQPAVPESATSQAKPVSESVAAIPSEESVKNMVDKTDPNWKSNVPQPEMTAFEPDKTYVWQLQTNQGTMTFRLLHEQSPEHVNSTIYLTKLGFYDDIIFHRVIPGFMAQGGDPTG
ncbi:MAG: hypothetical protein ACI9TP_001081, partial [Candidatus Azotimanducaceae bacterium]